MAALSVSIIVVSRDSAADLPHSLASAAAQRGVSLEIVVVDNASSDASRDVARGFAPAARLVALPENAGFAAAMNAGIEKTSGRYVLALNPDCRATPSVVTSSAGCARTCCAAVSARSSAGNGSSSGSTRAAASSSINTAITRASTGSRESSARNSATRRISSRSSGPTEITRQPATLNAGAAALTGKYSDRIATSPHMRMACGLPAGIRTARPGGIIHDVRSPVTVIAPLAANSN